MLHDVFMSVSFFRESLDLTHSLTLTGSRKAYPTTTVGVRSLTVTEKPGKPHQLSN